MGAVSSKLGSLNDVRIMSTSSQLHFALSQQDFANTASNAGMMNANAQNAQIQAKIAQNTTNTNQNKMPPLTQLLLQTFISLMQYGGYVFFPAGLILYGVNFTYHFLDQTPLFFILLIAIYSGYFLVMFWVTKRQGPQYYQTRYAAGGLIISLIIAAVLAFAVYIPPKTAINNATPTQFPFIRPISPIEPAVGRREEKAIGIQGCVTQKNQTNNFAGYILDYLYLNDKYQHQYCRNGLDFIRETADDSREGDHLRRIFVGILQYTNEDCSKCQIMEKVFDPLYKFQFDPKFWYRIYPLNSTLGMILKRNELIIILDGNGLSPFVQPNDIQMKIQQLPSKEYPNELKAKARVHIVNIWNIPIKTLDSFISYGYILHPEMQIAQSLETMIYAKILYTSATSDLAKLALLLRDNKQRLTIFVGENSQKTFERQSFEDLEARPMNPSLYAHITNKIKT